MLENLVTEFLKSADGAQTMGELRAHGLDQAQAEGAIGATVEGVRDHARSGGLLTQGGGLGSLAGGLLGGHANGGGALGGLVAPVAEVVARKTGLSVAMATTVVTTVLPRLLSLLHAKGGTGSGGLGGLLRGL